MPIKTSQVGKVRDLRPITAANAVVPLASRAEYVHEISALWKEAEDKFLTIGRYLVQARATLPHGEYQAMVTQDLLMGPAVARKLRTVAETIDSGALPVQDLPPNYTTIYLLATLPADARAQAEREGLIHPEVRRGEIEAFRRRVASTGSDRHDLLYRERIRLLARLREIEAELGDEFGSTQKTSETTLIQPVSHGTKMP
jgi:hypothetical protein